MAARVSSISWFRKGFWKVHISRLFGYCFVILPLRDLYTSLRLYLYFILFLCCKRNELGECITEGGLGVSLLLVTDMDFPKKNWRERANRVFFISREKPQGLGVGLVFLLQKRSGHHLRKRDSASCVPNPSSRCQQQKS